MVRGLRNWRTLVKWGLLVNLRLMVELAEEESLPVFVGAGHGEHCGGQ